MAETNQNKYILESVNWSFSTPFSDGRSGLQLFDCRKYHWYPATFIPEIPHTLIEVLSKPGWIVYDPFAGIGTTVFQALLLGRRPYASEVGRIPVELMRSMLKLFNQDTDLAGLADECADIKAGFDPYMDYSRMIIEGPTDVEQLRPWFAPRTFNQLSYLIFRERECRRPGTKAAMRVALSATLKAVCAQDRGWGCIADNVRPKPHQLEKKKDALARFERNLLVLAKDISGVRRTLPPASQEFLSSPNADSCISLGDARNDTNVSEGSVDLVVTSPPYPEMTDYSTSQRLSYYWLGADPMADVPSEIGARRKRFKANSVDEYSENMTAAIVTLCRKLKSGGRACLVMPIFNKDKQNDSKRDKAIQESLATFLTNGCVEEQRLDRILPTRRRHHNQGWTNLERERIHLYKKVE